MNEATGFAARVQGRLDRLGLSPEAAAKVATLPADFVARLLADDQPPPRGKRLVSWRTRWEPRCPT